MLCVKPKLLFSGRGVSLLLFNTCVTYAIRDLANLIVSLYSKGDSVFECFGMSIMF